MACPYKLTWTNLEASKSQKRKRRGLFLLTYRKMSIYGQFGCLIRQKGLAYRKPPPRLPVKKDFNVFALFPSSTVSKVLKHTHTQKDGEFPKLYIAVYTALFPKQQLQKSAKI